MRNEIAPSGSGEADSGGLRSDKWDWQAPRPDTLAMPNEKLANEVAMADLGVETTNGSEKAVQNSQEMHNAQNWRN